MHKELTKGMVEGGVPSAFIHSEGPNVLLDSVVVVGPGDLILVDT